MVADSWTATSDKLERLDVSTIAIDPNHPDYVYFTMGRWYAEAWRPLVPLFKSTDGGKTWHTFAKIARGTTSLVARYATDGDLVIYLATDAGIYRYKNTDYTKTTSSSTDWTRIRIGRILDMAVHPTNPSIVYASVYQDGVYRTDKALTATGNSDWVKRSTGLPDLTSNTHFTVLDIWEATPTHLVCLGEGSRWLQRRRR